MQYRLLCLDLDGTLLNEKKEISKKNKEAVKLAWEQGIEICIASGRSFLSAAQILDELGVKGSVVALNGGQVYYRDQEIGLSGLPKEVVLEVIEVIRQKQMHGCLNNGAITIVLNGYTDAQVKRIAEGGMDLTDYRLETCEAAADQVEAETENILKISIQDNDLNYLEEVREQILAAVDASVAKSDVDYLDVFRKGQSKWSGIEILLAHMGITREECVCFGDNENDLEMLAHAGLGVAMGNAELDLKELADFVTLKNSENGVAYGILNWVL